MPLTFDGISSICIHKLKIEKQMKKLTKNNLQCTANIADDRVLATVDYSKKENQIGCGYCYYEEDCTEKEPTVNKAKKGCKRFRHYSEYFQ